MTAAASTGSPLWYASRAGGTLALLLLTATVVFGIAHAGRYSPGRGGRFEIGLLHRNLSVLTLTFLVVHIVTAILDPFVHLSWAVSVVPFGASYRPLWLGLGTAAFDLLLAVLITSAVRHRLGLRSWRAVHWLVYAAWPLALFHGVGAGTDTELPLQLWLYACCIGAVVAAVWWRLLSAGPGRIAVRAAAAVAAAVVPALLTAFLATGPLRPGWSEHAAATHAAATHAAATPAAATPGALLGIR